MRITVPKWAWGWVATAVAALFALWAWDSGAKAFQGSQEEVKAAVAAMTRAEAEKARYEANNAILRQTVDSLAKVRARKDTLYIARRDSTLVWLDPITGISPDSAAKLIPVIQNACRAAITSCDEARAAAAEENAGLRQRTVGDSVRIGSLTQTLDSVNIRLLDALTDPEPAPTFGEKVKKVATVVVVILAIIGSFLLGQAAP